MSYEQKLTLIKDLGMRKDKNGLRNRCGLYKCGYCGNIKEIQNRVIKCHNPASCGCLRGKNITHGLRRTRFYNTWATMVQRGTGKHKRKGYYDRGIRICDSWLKFINFRDDMYAEYLRLEGDKNKLEIERIDNDKGYCKENCRWATEKEQANNKRNNRYITNPKTGERKTLKQWSEHSGINYGTLMSRWHVGHNDFNALFYKGNLCGKNSPRIRY